MKKRKLPQLWYRILRPILTPLFKIYYGPKVIDKHLIPDEGPIIFAGNHRHIMDQCLVIISTKRVVHYMAKKEYFEGPFAWFFKATGVISVDRSIHDKNAKEQAIEVLKDGGTIGIFPEGTRNKTDEILLPFKMGAVSLAQKTEAKIVPFAITGEFSFKKRNVTVHFGKPFEVKKEDSLLEANDRLREEINRLILLKGENH